MWAEISRLTADDRMTILLTAHYLDEADQLASDLAIVDRGRIVATGSPESLKSELRGDTVQVELADEPADGRAQEAVERVSGVTAVSLKGRSLRASADDGASSAPAVLAALDAAGHRVASVTMARPSLDDVYLRHAGRAFHEADAGGEGVAA